MNGGEDGGTYEIPKENNLKSYYIKNDNYTNDFGTGKIIAPMEETNGNDRFYIMSLSDIDSNSHYWYYNATELDDIVAYNTNDFGDGKTKTVTMINKWNSSAYGAQNANDMWGIIQDEVADGWFVPSKSELAAFMVVFDITKSNFFTCGLSSNYWTSSQNNTRDAFYANFIDDPNPTYEYGGYVRNSYYVRLATTF